MVGRLCGQVSDTREIVARSQRRNERGALGAGCVEGFPSLLALIAMSEMRGEHESIRTRAEATHSQCSRRRL